MAKFQKDDQKIIV